MASHSNKKKKKKKRKLLLGEQPFYIIYIERPNSSNLSIEELLGEHPFYSSYIEKPKSRNLSIEELLGEHPFYKQPMKKPKRKRKKISNLEFLQVLPFYDDFGIFKRKRAHKKCLGSYHVECIAKSLSDSLFSSKEKDKKVI